MRAFALGGMFVAGTLWIPGQRLISIPKLRGTMEELEQIVARFLLNDAEVIRYRDLWIAASLEGGALLSKDGIHWEGIAPTELYSNGDRVVSVTHQYLEECGA
jgi:hypothetical protein